MPTPTIQQQLGQHTEAFMILENALAIEPNHAGANLQMAQLHMQRQEYQKAKNYLQRANTVEPKNETVAKALAQVHTASGQLDAASEVYQSLTQTPSQDAVVLHVTALECQRHQSQIHGFRHTVLKISQYDTNDLALQR